MRCCWCVLRQCDKIPAVLNDSHSDSFWHSGDRFNWLCIMCWKWRHTSLFPLVFELISHSLENIWQKWCLCWFKPVLCFCLQDKYKNQMWILKVSQNKHWHLNPNLRERKNIITREQKEMLLDVGFIILCLHGRLCTMTPAEVEPGSGTVSFALNTWQLEITLQLRWVLHFCLCQYIWWLSFRFEAAHHCV